MTSERKKPEGVRLIVWTMALIFAAALIYIFVAAKPLGAEIDKLVEKNSKLRYDMAAAEELASDPAKSAAVIKEESELQDEVTSRISTNRKDLESIVFELARQAGLEEPSFREETGAERSIGDTGLMITIGSSELAISAKGEYSAGRKYMELCEGFGSGIFHVEDFAFADGSWVYRMTYWYDIAHSVG